MCFWFEVIWGLGIEKNCVTNKPNSWQFIFRFICLLSIELFSFNSFWINFRIVRIDIIDQYRQKACIKRLFSHGDISVSFKGVESNLKNLS